MKKDVSKKKVVLILLSSFIALLLLLGILFFVFFRESDAGDDDYIFYYPADYDENIFENTAYLGFERNLLYGAGGVEQIFNREEDYEEASAECQFFLDYFHAVINGEYDSFSDFFVEGFFEEEPTFTMQMLYDPYVTVHSTSQEEIDGEKVTVYNFYVRYKIFKNNGTFRRGIQSNTAVPQIYQLIKDEGTYRILRILDVDFED